MITLEQFNSVQPNQIITEGTCINSPEDVYMCNHNIEGKMIWAAIKGYANDWCIYAAWEYQGKSFLYTQGQKIANWENIKKLMPCEEEVMKKYRY